MTRAADNRPFSQVLRAWDWDDTTARILAKTPADVERALTRPRLDDDDFMALLSPAADPYLERMARMARDITLRRFGRTISMYIPLYVSNACTNSCVYCGFNHHNALHRVTLTQEQVRRECEAIRRLGPFENLLIVSGEFPSLNGPDYLAETVRTARDYFANITIEVMPMRQSAYELLVAEGINGVVCFQETYNEKRYNVYHPRGMKSVFDWRVDGFDRMGAAGVHKIGMGVLIGLEDWRTDLTMLARHLRWLKQRHWRARYSVNFPRLCPAEGGFQPNTVMTDRQLVQATLAMRIFEPDTDISYSTREPALLRRHMMGLGVTSMSAGSRTDPGGYAGTEAELEQFHVSDERAPLAVAADIRDAGFEAVWKDWDRVYN